MDDVDFRGGISYDILCNLINLADVIVPLKGSPSLSYVVVAVGGWLDLNEIKGSNAKPPPPPETTQQRPKNCEICLRKRRNNFNTFFPEENRIDFSSGLWSQSRSDGFKKKKKRCASPRGATRQIFPLKAPLRRKQTLPSSSTCKLGVSFLDSRCYLFFSSKIIV